MEDKHIIKDKNLASNCSAINNIALFLLHVARKSFNEIKRFSINHTRKYLALKTDKAMRIIKLIPI